MTVPVTSDDVAAGWRPLTAAEVTVAEALVGEATVLLTALVPGIDSKSEDLVRLVIAKMVRRVLKNPEGWRIKNESIDDYTEGGTIDSSLSTGELYASSEELSWLGVRTAGRAFEIRLGSS
jgi:hypothetical protein